MVQHKAQNVTDRPRTEDIKVYDNIDFNSMWLPEPILEGLKKTHYLRPSPIQRKAIPLVRSGLDLIVQAKAGTGKTCVFTVAALDMVKPNLPHLQAVVLAPTREIALQITDVINAIGQAMPGLKTNCFIGGYPVSLDMKNAVNCHIAVGAPGRMRHLMDKGLLKPQHVRLFVLDEADKLMEEAFVDDINKIFSYLPESKQVLACSATYTPELVEFLNCYMNHGQYVTPSNAINATVLLGIRQYVSVIPHHVNKLAALKLKENQLLYLLKSVSFNQCLIFSNLHSRAVSLCNVLRGQGWSTHWIAGRQDQADRVIALSQLKEQRVRVLVTTDLTARGIDIERVNLIINLDLPRDHHTYLHRMGRAGRYGSHGIVITVLSEGEELVAFQKMLGAIGGTGQYVNRIPVVLKNIDLWNIAEEDLVKVHGILEAPINSSESSTNEETGDSTDTDEKFSQESTDADDDQDQIICNGNHISKENTCLCDLYEVDSSNIETICIPSLFSVSKKEDHWEEVLPVIVHESKLPLNIPVILLGSKLVRVKFWDRIQKNIVHDDVDVNKFEVDFERKCDEGDFLSFEEINCTLESEVKFEIEKVAKEYECDKLFKFQEIKDILESSDVWEDSNRSKYEEIKKVLIKCEIERRNLENILLAFDSFDVVGWMAVDKTLDIWEDLKTGEDNVFEFGLVQCAGGKNHLKISSSPSDLVQEVSNNDDHMLALNLEEFNLTFPFCLVDIQKVMKEAIRPSDKVAANKTVINGKDYTKMKVTTETASGEVKNNVKNAKKNQPPKQSNRNKAKSNLTNVNSKHNIISSQRTTPQHPLTNKSVCNKATEKLNKNSSSKNSLEKSTSIEVPPSLHPKAIIDRNNTTNSRKVSANKGKGKCSHRVSDHAHIYRKSENVDHLEKKSISSQSYEESDTSSSESGASEVILCSAPNGHHCSLSVTSEESDPYVDMTHHLMKCDELHDCEEFNSESSEEYEHIQPSAQHLKSYSHTDTTDCSPEALVVMHNKLPGQVDKGKKCHKYNNKKLQWSSEESNSSVESEVSNCHSFQTVHSQHYGGRTCENEYSSVPSFMWDNCSDCECDETAQNPICNNCNITDARLSEYKRREYDVPVPDVNPCCYYEQPRNQNAFERCSSQSSASRPHKSYHGSYKDLGLNAGLGARLPKRTSGPSAYRPHESYHKSYKDPRSNTGLGSRLPHRISGPNLFYQWYTTWYTEVRKKAHELAMAEYINTMSRP